jgi:hypothetical protein
MNVEFDLKELLIEINNKIDKLDAKVDRLEEKFDTKFDKIVQELSNFKTKTAEDFGAVRADIAGLDAKVEGLGKRIDTQEFINRGVIVGLLLALLGGFAKIFGFVS